MNSCPFQLYFCSVHVLLSTAPKELLSCRRSLYIGYFYSHYHHQSLELLKKKKKRKYVGGLEAFSPRKFLKVETKICAIWGILEANLKKSSTQKFIVNISILPSICIHRSIILIFIEKNACLLIFLPWQIFRSAIFDFHFHKNPRFRDEFQALIISNITVDTVLAAIPVPAFNTWGWRGTTIRLSQALNQTTTDEHGKKI